MTPPTSNGSHAAKPLEFKGVFPAPPTPTAEDGSVNEEALRALLNDNIATGSTGSGWPVARVKARS